ncbi:glycosyltransferase [Amycolatopsis sp. NPDC058986]|uniref:glycosyltransferase n=1 Tax=unclassified Amycolatopsis TaxID=2618356 RepID=UPI00366C7F1D
MAYVGMAYYVVLFGLGTLQLRRAGLSLRTQETAAREPGGSRGYRIYYVIAALNEEQVIGRTVDRLVRGTTGQVIVVDDGSADDTSEQARLAGGDRITVLRRELPNARRGKGEALNHALRHIVADTRADGADPRSVLVCVMDADGELSPGAETLFAEQFTDPAVGGVQLAVRIRNNAKVITRVQDVEFWLISALSQFGRMRTGTVSLGGNGQCTRLSALLDVGEAPWSRSITEDLDLSISFNVLGWRTTSIARAYVSQQGVTRFDTLLRQRTRWIQGTMQATARIPEIWRSRALGNAGALELCYYTLLPWILILPAAVVQQYLLVMAITDGGIVLGTVARGGLSGFGYGLLWYLTSFLPNLVMGFLYHRRTRQVSLGYALFLGHLLIIWNYIAYVSAFRALGRIIIGRRNWAKTARVDEREGGEPCTETSFPVPASR